MGLLSHWNMRKSALGCGEFLRHFRGTVYPGSMKDYARIGMLVYLAAVTIPLALCDLRERRLPNGMVVPGLALAAIATLVSWVEGGDFPLGAILAGVGAGAVFYAGSSIGEVGGGDIKLAALIGWALGLFCWQLATVALACGCVLGGLWGVAALVKPTGRKSVPLGVPLLIGAWIVVGLWMLDAF